MGRRRVFALLLAGPLLAACGVLPSYSPAPNECGWPTGTEVVWAGEGSPRSLGFEAPGDFANYRGSVYVSAEAIEGDIAEAAPQRSFCVVLPEAHPSDIDVFFGAVPDDWEAP